MGYYTLPYDADGNCCPTCPVVQSCDECTTVGICDAGSPCLGSQNSVTVNITGIGTIVVPFFSGAGHPWEWKTTLSDGTQILLDIFCFTAPNILVNFFIECFTPSTKVTEWQQVIPASTLTCNAGTGKFTGTISLNPSMLSTNACNPNVCFCTGTVPLANVTSLTF